MADSDNATPAMIPLLRQLFGLLSPRERRQFFALIPLLFVGSFLEVVGVGIIPVFLGAAIRPEALEKVPLFGEFLADVGRRDPVSLLRVGSVAVVAVFLVKSSFQILQRYAVTRYAKGRQISLGFRLFRAYQNAPLESLFERNNALIIRSLNSDVQMVCNSILMALLDITIAAISCAGILSTILIVEWKAAIPLLVLGGGVGLLYALYLNPRSRQVGRTAIDARTDMVRELTESLGSLRETRVMGLEQFQASRIHTAMKTTARSQVSQMVMGSLATPILEALAVAGILGTVVVLVTTPEDLVQLIPLLTLLVLSLVRLRSYVSQLFVRWNALSFRLPALQTVMNDIITFEAQAAARAPVNPQPFRLNDAIVLDNVCYRYPRSEGLTLSNVNLRIPKGDVVAVTGKTGSGKTTLVDLVLGILRPESGSVTIDGVPIHEIQSLREHIGYVPQFIHLYDDTLRSNIALGMNSTKIDDDQVWRALEQAQIADFVRSDPLGLSMPIGENGVRLSGGQRQRLGLARALFHSPELLVLDEGTSALDQETEQEVMKAIRNLPRDITVILIAHRMETLVDASSRIVVESGTAFVEETISTEDHQ